MLDDVWYFNVETLNWGKMMLDKEMPSLSHHTAVSVFQHGDRISDLYQRKEFFSKEKVSYF